MLLTAGRVVRPRSLAVLVLLVLAPAVVRAQRETTREAIKRLEETLLVRSEEGALRTRELLPIIVVSTRPTFEASRTWYPTAAVGGLVRVFGAAGIRLCEACMAPRLHVGQGRLEQASVGLTTAEIVSLDETHRGSSPPARTAAWLDETGDGVALRMIDLRNGRVVVAESFDPMMREPARTRRTFTLAQELDRRARGDSITHAFMDVLLVPHQHVALEWAEQWGETNANLSGLSLSLFDPVLGIGGVYYRVVPSALRMAIGVKLLASIPTAVVRAFAETEEEVIDPLLTATFLARVPIASSNWAITGFASTNGRIGIGVSLMNTSLLPFLP